MNKMKTKEATKTATTNPQVGSGSAGKFDDSEFVAVELSRKWYHATEGQSRIHLLPLARSENVRSIYPTDYPGQENSELYVWACEIYCTVGEADRTIFADKEPTSAEIGEIVFMFENARLRGLIQRAHANGYVITFRAVAKREIASAKYGKVMAWEYADAAIRPQFVQSVNDATTLLLPSAANDATEPAF